MTDVKLQRYKDCYDMIKEFEESDEVKSGSRGSFTVVRNFIANKIAEMIN